MLSKLGRSLATVETGLQFQVSGGLEGSIYTLLRERGSKRLEARTQKVTANPYLLSGGNGRI